MHHWNDRRAQSTVEYAVLAAVVVGALLAMQIYMKRGTMGKLREASDQVGDQFTPLSTTSDFTTTRNVARTDTITSGGQTTSAIVGQETQTRTGSENVTAALGAETLF